ncbi:phosphatase PAP2 family protein [Bradyrhizobium sp.]
MLYKAKCTLSILFYFVIGFYGVQFVTLHSSIVPLGTRLDYAIPFVPSAVWLYLWTYPAAFAPLILMRGKDEIRTVTQAYAVTMTVSFVMFCLLPASAFTLRPISTSLNLARPSEWVVANVYALDPPGNLFPSLHVSLATLSAFAVWKSGRIVGAAAFLGAVCVALGACMIKQHFVVDVAGGFALAGLVARFTLRAVPTDRVSTAFDWRRAASMLVVIMSFYLMIYWFFLQRWRIHHCPDVTGGCLQAF